MWLTKGINDDYGWYAGNIGKPCISTIAYSQAKEAYISKEDDAYEDCFTYYGYCADDWTEDECRAMARKIPWEDMITVYVSATQIRYLNFKNTLAAVSE